MVTLQQYQQFLDAMWVAYLIPNQDEKRVQENILAIEAAYRRIDKLKWDRTLENLLSDLEGGNNENDE